jgi:hypothetical protein
MPWDIGYGDARLYIDYPLEELKAAKRLSGNYIKFFTS